MRQQDANRQPENFRNYGRSPTAEQKKRCASLLEVTQRQQWAHNYLKRFGLRLSESLCVYRELCCCKLCMV